jgi:hypothetical protein
VRAMPNSAGKPKSSPLEKKLMFVCLLTVIRLVFENNPVRTKPYRLLKIKILRFQCFYIFFCI